MGEVTFNYDVADETVFMPNAPAYSKFQPLFVTSAYAQGGFLFDGPDVAGAVTGRVNVCVDDQAGGGAAVRTTFFSWNDSTMVYCGRNKIIPQGKYLAPEESESGLAISPSLGGTFLGEFQIKPANLIFFAGIWEPEFPGQLQSAALRYGHNWIDYRDGSSAKILGLAPFDAPTFIELWPSTNGPIVGAEAIIPLAEGLRLMALSANEWGAPKSWTTYLEADLDITEDTAVGTHYSFQTPPERENENGEHVFDKHAWSAFGSQRFGDLKFELAGGFNKARIGILDEDGIEIKTTGVSVQLTTLYTTPWDPLGVGIGFTGYNFHETQEGFVSVKQETPEFGMNLGAVFTQGPLSAGIEYYLVLINHHNDIERLGNAQGLRLSLTVGVDGEVDLTP